MIFVTIAGMLTASGIAGYSGARLYWARVQEPGRHRQVS